MLAEEPAPALGPLAGTGAVVEQLGPVGLLPGGVVDRVALPADALPGRDRELVEPAVLAGRVGGARVAPGLALRERGVAVNALWPRTVIATDAINMIPGVELSRCRTPDIMADAAHAILTQPAREATGQFYIDETVLRSLGLSNFDAYANDPTQQPLIDFFLDEAFSQWESR